MALIPIIKPKKLYRILWYNQKTGCSGLSHNSFPQAKAKQVRKNSNEFYPGNRHVLILDER